MTTQETKVDASTKEAKTDSGKKAALVAMLITNRDSQYVKEVFRHLDESLAAIVDAYDVDLVVSTRLSDTEAREQCQAHVPSRVRRFEFLEAKYTAQFSGRAHSEEVLNAICKQRNAVREYARTSTNEYAWLFFLDSDIYLNPDTLSRLVGTGLACVGAPYRPRWSQHCVVGVIQSPSCRGVVSEQETQLQLLLDPHLLRPQPAPAEHTTSSDAKASARASELCLRQDAFPCAVLGFGAMLIRRALLHVPYRIDESTGGVRGEDVGFCLDLLALGDPALQPYFLSQHIVRHLSGGLNSFVPCVDRRRLLRMRRKPPLSSLSLSPAVPAPTSLPVSVTVSGRDESKGQTDADCSPPASASVSTSTDTPTALPASALPFAGLVHRGFRLYDRSDDSESESDGDNEEDEQSDPAESTDDSGSDEDSADGEWSRGSGKKALQFPCAMLTHVREAQLHWVENDLAIKWRVMPANGRCWHDCIPLELKQRIQRQQTTIASKAAPRTTERTRVDSTGSADRDGDTPAAGEVARLKPFLPLHRRLKPLPLLLEPLAVVPDSLLDLHAAAALSAAIARRKSATASVGSASV